MLFIAAAQLIAARLVKDLRILDQLDAKGPDDMTPRLALLRQLSLVGKWAQMLHGSHDRHTNIATTIAMLLLAAQVPSVYPHPRLGLHLATLPGSHHHPMVGLPALGPRTPALYHLPP